MHEKKSHARYYQNLLHRYLVFKPKLTVLSTRDSDFLHRSCHCAAVLHMQIPKLCTDLDSSLFYILIIGTCSKFARKNNFLALGVCFPLSPARALAACLPRQDHVYSTTAESFRFHNKNFDEMRCKLDSTENT